jgi:hypothetical protein
MLITSNQIYNDAIQAEAESLSSQDQVSVEDDATMVTVIGSFKSIIEAERIRLQELKSYALEIHYQYSEVSECLGPVVLEDTTEPLTCGSPSRIKRAMLYKTNGE